MKIKQFFLMAVVGLMAASLTSCNHDLSDHFGVSDNPSDGGSSASVSSLTFTVTNLKLGLNSTTPETLTANISPSDATITWSSNNETVATVDATGKVTVLP